MSVTPKIEFDNDGLPIPPKRKIQFDEEGLPIPEKVKVPKSAGEDFISKVKRVATQLVTNIKGPGGEIKSQEPVLRTAGPVEEKIQVTEEEQLDPNDLVGSFKKRLAPLAEPSIPGADATYVRPNMDAIFSEQERKRPEVAKKLEQEKNYKDLKNAFLTDENLSVTQLMRATGLSANQIKGASREDIMKMARPGNETDKLAAESVAEAQDINAAFSQSRNLEEAAIRLAASKDPQVARQLEITSRKAPAKNLQEIVSGTKDIMADPKTMFGEATIGRFIYQLATNPIAVQQIEKNPNLKKQFKETLPLLINKYPDFGKSYLGNVISQKMEDMGINNALLNVVTKEETDKAVEQLESEGKISPIEVQFYKDNMREGGFRNFAKTLIGEQLYKTPGAIERTLESAVGAVKSTGTGLMELTGARQALVGERRITARDIAAQDMAVNIKPRNTINEISAFGGDFLGQILPTGLIGKGLTSLKLFKDPNTSIRALFGLQAFGNYLPQARAQFPGEELKQRAYAGILAGLEIATENIFQDKKIVDGLMGKIKPEVANVIRQFTDKQISAAAARETIQGYIKNALQSVPQYTKYFGKAVGQNTVEETAVQLGEQLTDGVFTGKKYDDWINGEELLETARTSALGSVLIGGLAARADMMKAKGITAKMVYDMAEKPDYWIAKIKEGAALDPDLAADADDKIANLEYASKVRQDLESTNLSEKQKIKYLINALEANVKAKSSQGITDPVLKKKAEQQAKEVEKQQEAILNGDDQGEIEGDLSDEVVEPAGEVPQQTLFEQISKRIEEIDAEEKGAAGEVKPEVPQTVEQLRAAEQAEYAAMADPNDEVKRQEIYDRYDKLITPLLEKEKEVSAAPTEEKKEPISLRGVKYSDIVVGNKYLEDILSDNNLSDDEKKEVREIFSRNVDYFKFDKEGEQKFQEKFANPEDITDVADIIAGVSAAQQSAFDSHNTRNYENVKDAVNYIVNNPNDYSSKVVKAVKEIKEKIDNPSSSMNRLYAIDVMKELGIKEQPLPTQKGKVGVIESAPVPSIIEVKSPKEVKQGDTIVWRGEDFIVEEVNPKGGFNLRNAADRTNTVKDARITDEEFQGKRGEVAAAPKVEKFGVGFAPFREKNVFTEEEDVDIRTSPDYQLHQENVQKVAQGLGIKINNKLDTWGGYVDSETGNPVQEVSNIMEIEATPEQARVMAAILGKAAPEMQDSVLLGNYNENGAGFEHIVKTGSFANAKEAIKLLKDNELQYFSVDKNSGDVIILDLEATDTPKIINLVKQLNENGIPAKHKYGKVNAEFIGSGDYDGIIEAERSRVGAETGFDIDAFVQEAAGKYDAIKAARTQPVVSEVQKSIADKIRGLKIDLSKLGEGGAQSNIAGLPVALYNTVVEAVALAVEAGVAVNKAINDAVKQYKLDKAKDFDKDVLAREILKGIEITEPQVNPVYFENLKKFASESSFDNKIQFKNSIQSLFAKYLPELKAKFGKDFDPSNYDERARKYLVDLVTRESLNAIKKHPEAIGWYDEKTQSALDVISAIHPEIATDAEARGAFILPLAIMSNGNKVDFNFELAEKQYQFFKDNGRFNPDGEFGLQQSGIKKSLMLINSLLDNGLTMSDINKFLTSKYRAGDLKIKIDGKVKDLASGELADEQVYGAVILGPKIGNGFYMNLWGQFDQLTMDRWFMRTWGRMTGTLIEKDAAGIAEGKKRLSKALDEIKKDSEALAILKSLLPKISSLSIQDLAKSIEKVSMDKKKRAELSSNPKTDELRKAANSLSKNLSGEKEAPSTGKERRFIREVFTDVVNDLKNKYGIEISMADLQAALWYPEKILYESFKGGETFEAAAEGYTSDSAPDYLNAAKKLATKLGVNEEQINQALSRGRERAERIAGEGYPEGGRAISESYQDILGRVKEAIGEKPATEKVRAAAKTVRSLKIKQEGLQANIAGIPIALYNAALETIATALEAGASLTDAIREAIRKHKLNKQKDFDSDTFVKQLESVTGQTVEKIGGKYAIQIEAAGEVPVQPKAGVSEEVEGGVPGAKPQAAPEEGKAEGEEEKVTPEEMVGIKHKSTEKIRIAYSLPEYERPQGKTMDELEAEADQKIKSGYNVESLIKKLEDGNPPSGVENIILSKYLGVLNADFDKTKSKETLAKIKRVVSALDIIGTIQSESFRTRQVMKPKEDTLAQYFMDEEADAGVDELTPEQEATITREYEEIKAAKEALQKKVEELQEQNAKLLAEGNIAEEKKKAKKTRKTDADFKQERKSIVSDIKDKLKKARSQSNVTVVPYANELFAISPDIAKLVKSYVEQGIVKLEDIVDNIHELLKDDIKDITKKDVQDLIAGEYQKKKPTRNELAAKVRELKTEAKLLAEYEKLEAGVPKTEKQKIEKNRNLADLRKRIKENDLTKLSEAKSRMKAQIEKVEQQIKKGDFEKAPEKKVIKLDEEGRKLQAKLTKLRKERDVRRLTLQYQKQNKVQRTFNKVLEVFNIPRSLMASTDFSAPLNQAVIATINYPKEAKEAAIQMVKAAASQEAFDNWFYDLKETPRYELMNKLKLGIADPFNPELQAREEAFMSGYAEQIPGLGKLVKGSERAYVQYLNKLRVDLFNKFVDKFENDGKTYENSKKLYESAAKYVNNITGRGELGKLQKFAPLFSALFFSPRLMAARINMLNPIYFATLPTELKKQYGKDMGTALGLLSTMLTLFALYGKTQDDDDEDKITVETDPRSSDFARVKQGDSRWDFSGGFQPYLRATSQYFSGQRKKTSTGEIMELEGKVPGTGKEDILISFFRNKLAPVPAMIWDFSTGKNAVGEKVELKDELLKNVIPLSFQSIYEGYEKKGPQALATVGLPAIFGVGVSTYEQRKKEVPESIVYQDRRIELNEEQRAEFQRIFDERNGKNIEKLKSLPEYKNADKIMRGELEQLVENKSLSESKEILGKKYRRDFLMQPKEIESREEKRVKQRFRID